MIKAGLTINVRRVGKYKEVNVSVDNTNICLGLHNEEESKELAKTLLSALSDLFDDNDERNEFIDQNQ